jgi:hypothetical protein
MMVINEHNFNMKSMKRYKYYAVLLLFVVAALTGCKVEDPELGIAPTAADVKFSFSPDNNNPNIIHFKNESGKVTKAIWDFGNGTSATGDEPTGSFAVAGDYTVSLTIFTSGGYALGTKTLTIANTNPAMLDREDYNFLTGGGSSANGKTWVIDKDFPGHMGVGPAGASTPEWWQAPSNDKAGEGLYDDEMTFNLNNNFAYTYNNNGNTFVNGSNAAGLGGTAGNDYTLAYTPPSNLTWSIAEEDGKSYLTISNGGFIGYYTGVSKYQILALSENELYLKVGDNANAANAWWLRLVPKGFTRPIVEKPLKAADLFDSFDGTGNVVWYGENITFKPNFDNPFPKPVNTSPKIAFYEKLEGDANQYGNLQTTLGYRMDLSTRNKFTLKVFMSSVNDYVLVKQQVAVKLQNSLDGGNSWQTQKEVIQVVAQANQWVELEFDFSAFSAETKYDKIIVQLGGEGHPNPGIFYIDDFKLE